MRVKIRVRDQDRAGFVGGQRISPADPESLSGQGSDESSPVRSVGLVFLKRIRPGRDDRNIRLLVSRWLP
jgi:hypothetical protein